LTPRPDKAPASPPSSRLRRNRTRTRQRKMDLVLARSSKWLLRDHIPSNLGGRSRIRTWVGISRRIYSPEGRVSRGVAAYPTRPQACANAPRACHHIPACSAAVDANAVTIASTMDCPPRAPFQQAAQTESHG